MGGVMIMPDNLLRCHPFVGKSHLRPSLADDEVDSAGHQDRCVRQ